MKVSFVLDAIASGNMHVGETVIVEGLCTWTGKPKNITGEKNGKAYDFWTEMILVKEKEGDDAGLMASLTLKSQLEAIAKGCVVKVKGELGSYEKDGKTHFTIERAHLINASGGQNAPAAPTNGVNTEVLIVRQTCLKAAAELYASGKEWEEKDVTQTAQLFADWVYGVKAAPAAEPVPDSEIPF